MTDNLNSAIEYGNGQLEVAQNLASESYDANQELERLSQNGYYIIQIPKSISNEIVKEAGEVKVIGDKIIIPKGQYKIEQVVDGIEQPEQEVPDLFTLEPTKRDNLYLYKDMLGKQYKDLVENNEDTYFIFNASRDAINSKFKNAVGQTNLANFAEYSSLDIPTSYEEDDNFSNLTEGSYQAVKDLWERRMNHITKLLETGNVVKIAFPKTGFGDPELMPRELFVYLSRRLKEEFGYVNPGSTMSREVEKTKGKQQAVTDQDIQDQFGLEENPFTCD
jgi:hypothetical protein